MTKKEVPNLDWLQLHHLAMETSDAELIKCFPKEGITTNRGEEIKGFLEFVLLNSS